MNFNPLGIITNLFGNVGNVVSHLIGNLFGFVTGSFTRLFGLLNGLLTGGLAVGIGLAVGALRGFASALTDAAKGALQFAQGALSLRSQTGLSYGAAGYLQARGTAFGMSAAQTGSVFGGNPFMGMFGFGARPTDPHFFSNLASTYSPYLNSGNPLNAMMGRGMLGAALGQKPSPEVLGIASMSPDKLRKQEDWFSGLWDKLGVGSGVIQTFAEDVSLLLNRLTTLREVGFLRLASAIGPSLVAGLEKVVGFLTSNIERIAPIVEKFVGVLSDVLVRGLTVALDFLERVDFASFIEKAFDWLLYDGPTLFLRAGALILRALGTVLEGFGNGANYLLSKLPDISTFFQGLTDSFTAHLPEIASALDTGFNTFRDFILGVVDFIEDVIGKARDFLGLNNNGSGQGPNGGQPGMPNGIVPNAFNRLGQVARNAGQVAGLPTMGDPNSGGFFQNSLNTLAGFAVGSQLLPWLVRPFGGGAAGAGAGGGVGQSALGRLASGAGGLWQGAMGRLATWGMMNTGTALGGQLSLPGVAVAATSAWPFAAGIGAGVAGYEGLRGLGNAGVPGAGLWKGMPSTFGILKYGLFGTNPYGNGPIPSGGTAGNSGSASGGANATPNPMFGPQGTNAYGFGTGEGYVHPLAQYLDRHTPRLNLAGSPDFLSRVTGMATGANNWLQKTAIPGLQTHLPGLATGALDLSKSAFAGADKLDHMAETNSLLRDIRDSAKGTQQNTGDALDATEKLARNASRESLMSELIRETRNVSQNINALQRTYAQVMGYAAQDEALAIYD